MVARSNAYVDLQTLICRPCCAPQYAQLVLQNVNGLADVQPMKIDHPLSSSVSLHVWAN